METSWESSQFTSDTIHLEIMSHPDGKPKTHTTPQLQMPIAAPQVALPVFLTHWLEAGVPTVPSWDWTSLLEQLTKLRQTCTYIHRFVMKIVQRILKCGTRDSPKGYPSGISMGLALWKLAEYSAVWICIEAAVCKHDQPSHWPLAINSTLNPPLHLGG